MSANLAACPFCGGVARLRRFSKDCSVQCDPCGFYLNRDGDEAEVIAAWNRRTSPGRAEERQKLLAEYDEARSRTAMIGTVEEPFSLLDVLLAKADALVSYIRSTDG